ncbi:RNA polymerase sigma factor [Solibacillus cecembensis]|uniref:RNA polymerase sigma factor n=1 Tax=Solibacillus cecembensis TaxID=459347 RepID=UPI003D00D4C8
MKKEDQFTSYLIQIGEEVFRLLRAKGASKEDAEDIIQNTFYKIYTLLDTLNDATIRPWFFRVALNEYIDFKRKKEHQNIHFSKEIHTKLQHCDDDFDAIFNKDEIFFLKYYYDFSYEEIAKLLGIQIDSVKQKLYRARKSIQTQVGGKKSWIQRFKKH